VRAIVAHRDPAIAASAADALEGSGWDVITPMPLEIRRACTTGSVDVAFIDVAISDADPTLVEDVKRRPESFATAVVLIAGADQTVAEALEAMGRGAQDVLHVPFSAAEVVARAGAGARTRALVEELLERDERIEHLVFVDELTGLYNRRYLLHHMGMLIAAARRHGHPLAAVLLDVDRFKAFNDTWGHAVGDDVLRVVADSIRSRVRQEDVAGRLGGDEFLVLLPDTTAEGAATVAEEIRATVALSDIRADGRHVRATVSVGWATWAGEDHHGLMKRADEALYAAKAAGRDRVAAAADRSVQASDAGGLSSVP
jgi:diguanylate cyclase (GGDEF)-like protein